jgi:hypothetical protein
MKKSDDEKIKQILHRVGLNNNLRDDDVRKIFESQFKFTYDTIRELELKEITEEQLDNLKTNFQYKYIGKLFINKETLKKKWKRQQT